MLTTLVVSSLVGGKYACKKGPNQEALKTALAVIFNITVSISIVLINKWLYLHVGFPNITLTLMHFISTFICLHICQMFGVFVVKRVPISSMIPLALCFCGFVVLTNLSLEHNVVGTYQVAKVLTTPCILLIQYQCYGKLTSMRVLLTIIPIIVGVTLNFIYDIKLNVLGTIYALAGVVVTSFYQVLVGEKQKELQLNSMQLLYYQAPLSAAILLTPVLLAESNSLIFQKSWTLLEMGGVGCSCLIAFAVNLSIFWIIGNTSALTYNMAGHLKFCLTLAAGYILFHDPLSVNQFVGLLLTLAGIVTYTHFRMKEDYKQRVQLSSVVIC